MIQKKRSKWTKKFLYLLKILAFQTCRNYDKRIQSLTSTSQVIPENNDYGDEEVQRHFEGKVMPDVSVPGANCAEVPLEGLTQQEEQGILLEIVD